MNLKLQKLKIFLMSNLLLIIFFIMISAFIKIIKSVSISKMLFEIMGFYISIFSFHFSNSLLKDYIREIKKI